MTRFSLAVLLLLFFVLPGFGAPLQTKQRGGCLIAYLRSPDPNDAFEGVCDRVPQLKFKSGRSFQEIYSWVPPFLAVAFDQAERGACGFLNCATDRVHVTLFLLANGYPNAGVTRSAGHMYLFVNTGLIDFTDAVARSYLADIRQITSHQKPVDGYRDWMAAMKAAGGRRCDWQWPMPTPTVPQEEMPMVQTVAQTTYQFLFGHEFAHYLARNYACGDKPPGLQREMACDERAINTLLRAKDSTMMPMGVVATMMALDSYLKIAGPTAVGVLGGTQAAGEIQEQMNTMSWQKRAEQVVDLWDRFCRSGADSKLCPNGYDEMIEISRALAESTAPTACAP